MRRNFSEEMLEQLKAEWQKVEERYNALMLGYTTYPFTNDRAKEFAEHGLGRRLSILRRCIHAVPPVASAYWSNRRNEPAGQLCGDSDRPSLIGQLTCPSGFA